MEKQYLNVVQAAELIGISRSTVYGYVYNRHIPFIKIGGRVVFEKKELIAWINRKKVKGVYRKY